MTCNNAGVPGTERLLLVLLMRGGVTKVNGILLIVITNDEFADALSSHSMYLVLSHHQADRCSGSSWHVDQVTTGSDAQEVPDAVSVTVLSYTEDVSLEEI